MTLILSIIIVFLTTLNMVTSLLSVICIGVIIVSEAAILKFLGCKIGIPESIGLIVIVGLSTNFCLILATEYQKVKLVTRNQRMK